LSNPRITGTLQPVRQPMKVSYDPQRGLQITIPWESAGNNLNGLAAAYQLTRVAYEMEVSGRKSTLVATASGGQLGIPDLTTDTWQILGNEIQKSGFEHPTSAAIDQVTINKIKGALQNPDTVLNPPLTGNAASLLDLMTRESTHYALGQYVLRHTTNVSNQYGINVSDFNIEKIYTTAQLISEATNGNSWIFPLPGRMVNKIQGLVAPQSRTQYLWGWRKLPSTESTTSGNRVEITTEYWLEQWSLYYYQTAS
jgi:hypothetical protein